MTSAYPVVPLTDGHRNSIGMTTIHERACFGVYADAALADDADKLLRAIDREIDDLLELCEQGVRHQAVADPGQPQTDAAVTPSPP